MRWKIIKDYPNYSISDTGIVKRNVYTRIDSIGRKTEVKEMILRQYVDKDGYFRVALSKNKKTYYVPVHRLVAKAFIDNNKNLPCVNHKNEIKIDNNVNNLEWCTISYNNNYGNRQKRVSVTQGKKIIGYNDTITMIFNSAREAGRTLGVSSANISECANGKFKQMYGYKWRWA